MAGKFQFVMRSGPTVGAIYPLDGELISIGRDASNTIQINDAEISRRHARLQFQGGKYVIEDVGSTNGTHVNGQRIVSAYVLKAGDVVSFGEGIVLGYETTDFDPAATLAVAVRFRAGAPVRSAAPARPGLRGTGPGRPDANRQENESPAHCHWRGRASVYLRLWNSLWWVDSANLWCTFFPFLGGVP